MFGVFGVVVLYEPTEEDVKRAVSLAPFVDKLYVVDNSERNVTDSRALFFSNLRNVEYLASGENKGIGYALNLAARRALAEDAR